ncbi:MAG: hypothetical protein EPN47_15125 [Acidobacteria bacterium]|nr:MAG: hypothetical protein EPN47_15125 [Acidobacteriota bacterium]
MSGQVRKAVAVVLCEVLVCLPLMAAKAGRGVAQTPSPAAESASLRDYLQKPYVELFETAPRLTFSTAEIDKQRKDLQSGEKFCVNQFKTHAKNYEKQITTARNDLKQKTGKLSDAERKDMHCQIQNLELLRSEAEVLSRHAIPTAYDNLAAKLDVVQKWPAEHKLIEQQIADGSYNQRRWGDVKDIGFREITAGQQDDIRRGQEAIQQMKRAGIMPPDLPDKNIQEYVDSVAQRIAKQSDLKIPLHVTVLQSREVNAFALPGGYIFVERGLLEEADDESELAGVLAHEIAHDVARHSNKLMKKATIAGIFYQAAQVAAMVLTGGIAGIGMYYALQYGFYGLGLVLSLQLLGVSREYELEADQLGVQYAWNSGYGPSGFTRFFDKMATRAGYVNSVSWFRTHPPFYQRMVDTQREIAFLPKKENLMLQTTAFESMKKALAPISAAAEKEEKGKPSLRMTAEQGCTPPQKLEYKPGQPIENLCAAASQKNQK